MQSLLAYGSDSDSDDSPAVPPPPPASKPTSSSLLSLPPPRNSASSLNLPQPKSNANKPTPTAPPTKKAKGPVRIMLDLPPPSATSTAAEDDGPAKKRPKIGGGSLAGGAPLTGLAAMLPKPKNESKPVPAPAKPVSTGASAGVGGLFDGAETGGAPVKAPGGPMFLPPSVAAKGKGKAAVPKAAPPPEPAVDFFGISSVTSAPSFSSTSSSSSSKLGISSAPTLSAPKPASPPPPPSRKEPTAADPYPGFTQLPSGEWVAKDQETYEMLLLWQAQQAAGGSAGADEVPRGFGEKDYEGQGGLVDVDETQRAKDAWATRPSTVPGREEEYKKATDVKGIGKQISGGAKRKHQLSSLLAAAHDNRAELEDRIAQARSNRKSAGNKYGF